MRVLALSADVRGRAISPGSGPRGHGATIPLMIRAPTDDLVDRLDAALPQTQCRRCGYDGCRPYAEAIAHGDAINKCPPGDQATIAVLAQISGRPVVALDPSHGQPGPLMLARIDEEACIGCVLCLRACPVDAIVGAPKRMHVVLAALCTGCELCVAPCPVDCIELVPAGRTWSACDATAARERFDARQRRTKAPTREPRVTQAMASAGSEAERAFRRAAVAGALERARGRRAAIARKAGSRG